MTTSELDAWVEDHKSAYKSGMAALYKGLGRERTPEPELPPTRAFGFVLDGMRGEVDLHERRLRVQCIDGPGGETRVDGGVDMALQHPRIEWLCEAHPCGGTVLIGVRASQGDGCIVHAFDLRDASFLRLPGHTFGRPLRMKGANQALLLWGKDAFRPSGAMRLVPSRKQPCSLFEDEDPAFFYRVVQCAGGRGALLIGKSTDGFKVRHVQSGADVATVLSLPAFEGPTLGLATGDATAVFVALSTTSGLHLFKAPLGPEGLRPCERIWSDESPDQYLHALALRRVSVLLVTGRHATPRLRAVHRDSGNCLETRPPSCLDGCEVTLGELDADEAIVDLRIANPLVPAVTAMWAYEEGLCLLPDASAATLARKRYAKCSFAASDGQEVAISIWRDTEAGYARPTVVACYGAYGRPPPLMHVPWLADAGVRAHFLVHVRGGGDLGPSWHLGGRGGRRARAIADFDEALDWLLSKDMITSARTVLTARSAGCIVVASTLAARPTLAACAVLEYPFLDLAGAFRSGDRLALAETAEWLDCVPTSDTLLILGSVCPVRRLTNPDHPPVLILTGEEDWRSPLSQIRRWHEAFTHAAHGGTAHALIRIDEGVGHGLPPWHPLARHQTDDICVFISASTQ